MIDFRTVGTKVTGTYMAVPITGTVTECRYHSYNHETLLVSVELDEPTVVNGRPRDSVLLAVYADGSNADSYVGVGWGDSIKVAER